MKKGISFGLVCLMLLAAVMVLGGCGRPYSEKEAEERMTAYYENKYGEAPQFEYIRWFQKKGESRVLSQGYYAKTTAGVFIRMNTYDDPKLSHCMDTGEYDEILNALRAYFGDNPVSNHYTVAFPAIDESDPAAVWEALRHAFTQKWEGDVEAFLNQQPPRVEFVGEKLYDPQLYLVLRAPDAWNYNADMLGSYVGEAAERLGARITYAVVAPFVGDEDLARLNDRTLPQAGYAELVYQQDSVSAILAAEAQSRMVARVRQAASIEGLDITVARQAKDGVPGAEEVGLEVTPLGRAPEQYEDGADRGKYRPVSGIFELKGGDFDSTTNVVLDMDVRVLLADYYREAPGAVLGRDIYLLQVSGNGWLDQVVELYDLAELPLPQSGVRAYASENTVAVSYRMEPERAYCFAVPVADET